MGLEVNGCKCMNQHHFADAEDLLGHPVTDSYTMNAHYNKSEETVALQCHWCGYEARVNVAIRPVQIKRFSGKYLTLGPPCKEVV